MVLIFRLWRWCWQPTSCWIYLCNQPWWFIATRKSNPLEMAGRWWISNQSWWDNFDSTHQLAKWIRVGVAIASIFFGGSNLKTTSRSWGGAGIHTYFVAVLYLLDAICFCFVRSSTSTSLAPTGWSSAAAGAVCCHWSVLAVIFWLEGPALIYRHQRRLDMRFWDETAKSP